MKDKIFIIGGMGLAEHMLITALMTNKKLTTVDFMTMDEVEKEMSKERLKFDEPIEYKRTYQFQEEPEPKVDLSKLHELHPFAKFIGNKRKKW
jgi:hypothetical protein